MKSIRQIFKNNPDLLYDPEVEELAEYCRELEEQVMYRKQDDFWSKEDHLAQLVREIYDSLNVLLKREEENIRFRFEDKVDFKEGCVNLRQYLLDFQERTKFNLNK